MEEKRTEARELLKEDTERKERARKKEDSGVAWRELTTWTEGWQERDLCQNLQSIS